MNELLLEQLRIKKELIPSEHDGSYELMKQVVIAYSHLENLDIVDLHDLKIVYLMSVGTWKHGIDAKKKLLSQGHLLQKDIESITQTIDSICEKAISGSYSNVQDNSPTIGMFGTGFLSFENKGTVESSRAFIKMLVEIKDLEDEVTVYSICRKVLTANFRGMKAASASMVLHCLKPYMFPILNNNQGYGDIFSELDIKLDHKQEIDTYIDNCIKIKTFRDNYLPFKNYRVLDLMARTLENEKTLNAISEHGIEIEYIESFLSKYRGKKYVSEAKAGDRKEEMVALRTAGILARNQFSTLSKLCFDVFDEFVIGKSGVSNWINQGQTVPNYFWAEYKKKDSIKYPSSISISSQIENDKYTIVVLVDTRDNHASKDDFDRHNRLINLELEDPNLRYRIEYQSGSYTQTELSRIEIREKIESDEIKKVQLVFEIPIPYTNSLVPEIIEKMREGIQILLPYYEETIKPDNIYIPITPKDDIKMRKNLILYGPPGTGKTYYTLIYAVAIIEGKSIDEVAAEAKTNYDNLFTRYLNYKKENQIEFITFHQSYGYEEFIEGIKPVLNDETANLNYRMNDGIFKKFCSQADKQHVLSSPVYINEDATIWKITLHSGHKNGLKEDCFSNSRIRIDWDQDEDLNENAQQCISMFETQMKQGDFVLSMKNLRTIDGIGIVTSDSADYLDNFDDYKRSRGVDWIVKNISEDIFEINDNHTMSRMTIHSMKHLQMDKLIQVIKKYNSKFLSTVTVKNQNKYVFIIDEINRGNISKIFGELITLIEDNKRIGAREEIKSKLPYSGEEFGVPENVYILGTMNTADRSIAMIDTALRRRFEFIEMLPKVEVLKELKIPEIYGIDVCKMLEKMNDRIEVLFDRDHTIGHAFFVSLKNDPSLRNLAGIMRNSVIPLLQEFFFEDYGKIQMILGDNVKTQDDIKFIKDKKTSMISYFKGNVEFDLPDKKYEINEGAFSNPESYIQIY